MIKEKGLKSQVDRLYDIDIALKEYEALWRGVTRGARLPLALESGKEAIFAMFAERRNDNGK